MKQASSPRRPRPWASIVFVFFGFAFLLGAGSAHVWGQAGFFIGIGGCLLLRPPRWSPNRMFNIACLGLLFWTVLQLSPGTAPSSPWRETLHWAGLLEAPSRAAVSVHAQALGFLWLVAAIGWLLVAFEVNARLEREQRRTVLGLFAAVTASLGLACFLMNLAGRQYPLNPDTQLFSLLPNRNHMALICVLGGVASFALGYERIARHRLEGALYLCATLLAFLGLLSLTSRAAVVLFMLGLILCILSTLHRRGFARRLKLIGPFAILLLAVLLTVGEVSATRLLEVSETTMDGGGMSRLSIYADTFAMMPSVIWSGSGWGGFEPVFPYFRDASMSFMAVIHPESDWLWLLAESGLVGLLFVILLMGSLSSAIFHGRERAERIRQIPLILLLLAGLHAFVDVPLHNAAVFLFLAWLAGLALPVPSSTAPRALYLPPAIWRGMGAGFLTVGGMVLYAAATGQMWLRSEAEKTSLAVLEHRLAVTDAVEGRLRNAAKWYPFSWTVHAAVGQSALQREDGAAAEAAFRRARAAQMDQGIVTWTEARLWETRAPGRTLAAHRATFLERAIFERENKFKGLLRDAGGDPAMLGGLGRISRGDPALRQLFFEARTNPVVAREAEIELARHPRLTHFESRRRAAIFQQLAGHLGWARLAKHIEAYPSVGEAYPLIAALAQCELAEWSDGGQPLAELVQEPPTTRYAHDFSRAQLEARHQRSPEDVAVALAFLRELVKNRDWESVAELTAAFRAPPQSVYPPSLYYWGARSRYELFLGPETAMWWRAFVEHLLREQPGGGGRGYNFDRSLAGSS